MAVDENAGVEARIAEIFRRALSRQVNSTQTDLLESGLLDSLALVELLVEIENEFEIQLALDKIEIENFRTIETIGRFVESQAPRTA